MSNESTNVIISFANQKGGVGKTTLCALMAHYLHQLGVPVMVVDADKQGSLSGMRGMNLNYQPATTTLGLPDAQEVRPIWSITQHNLSDAKETQQLFEELRQFEGVVLIDSPGSLLENGLVVTALLSDYIFCPFRYELQTLHATAKFVVFLQKVRNRYGNQMKSQLLFIPNHRDVRFGTKEEKARIDNTLMTLRQYGKVSPDVDYLARLQNYSTLTFSKVQHDACQKAFDFLINETKLRLMVPNPEKHPDNG